jgi:Protein of unknown function (DUF1549)/Protein of unknown function (DUF1553)
MHQKSWSLLAVILAYGLALSGLGATEGIPSVVPLPVSVDPAAAAQELDAILASHWKSTGAVANPPLSDEAFVRRIYLDVAGHIPTVAEVEEFFAATGSDKRARLIDRLLAGEGYVQRYFQVWADALRLFSRMRPLGTLTGLAYQDFVKQSLRSNKPYDVFVRELITAQGRAWENGAIGYQVRDTGMPLDHAAVTARVFLGTRIECAQCHDHPFDDQWTQKKFYHMAGFTTGFGEGDYYGKLGLRDEFAARYRAIEKSPAAAKNADVSKAGLTAAERKEANEKLNHEVRGVVTVLNEIQGPFLGNNTAVWFKDETLKLPHDYRYPDAKPGDVVQPATAFGDPITAVGTGSEKLRAYAEWMTSPRNPRFTTVVTNRLWRSLFGRAVIDPLDDLSHNSTGDIPGLQARLDRLMNEGRYDLKAFLRVLLRTRAYQAQAARAPAQPGEAYAFTGPVLRRMTAEQIYDSFVTLVRPAPDQANPFAAEELARAIRETRRADALFRALPSHDLFDTAVAAATVLTEQAVALKKMQEDINAARKAGDKELVERLGKQAGPIQRQKLQAIHDQVLVPMMSRLLGTPYTATLSGKLNPILETVQNARIPGIDTAEGRATDTAAQAAMQATFLAEVERYRIPAKDRDRYLSERSRALRSWPRSADMESPAPRGHYLREFGQSDRETVDNSNPEANIGQALLLMNSALVPQATAPYAQLMLEVGRASDDEAKLRAVYLAVLARAPTDAERKTWAKAKQNGLGMDDLAAALLNTRQFLFIP